MQINQGKYDHTCKISFKNFAPSPIPNGKGHFLSLFQRFFAKNNACRKADAKSSYLKVDKAIQI